MWLARLSFAKKRFINQLVDRNVNIRRGYECKCKEKTTTIQDILDYRTNKAIIQTVHSPNKMRHIGRCIFFLSPSLPQQNEFISKLRKKTRKNESFAHFGFNFGQKYNYCCFCYQLTM